MMGNKNMMNDPIVSENEDSEEDEDEDDSNEVSIG